MDYNITSCIFFMDLKFYIELFILQIIRKNSDRVDYLLEALKVVFLLFREGVLFDPCSANELSCSCKVCIQMELLLKSFMV